VTQLEGKRGKRHLGIHYFREVGVFENYSWQYVYSTTLTLGCFMSVGVALAVSVKVTATINRELETALHTFFNIRHSK
jgi:hypothetical protein